MKFSFSSSLALAALSSLASALPAGTATSSSNVVARAGSASAATTDAVFGYASTNGGTTGGEGGTTTTVSTLAQFTNAVQKGDDSAKVVYVSGTITGATKVYPGSNTSILGLNSDSGLTGIGLYIKSVENVIVRNLKLSKVLAENSDAVGIQASKNVWIDHNEIFSDLDHGKDYYDGACDVTHASEWVTISWNHFHDHYKVNLVGHSDSNADEDTGHLHVTFANNYYNNVSSRLPSIRFGTVHIYNTYYDGVLSSGINTRMGAEVLVESTAFVDTDVAITAEYSDEPGYASVNDVDLGGGSNDASASTLTAAELGYEYSLLGSANVKAAVVGSAGNTLTLG